MNARSLYRVDVILVGFIRLYHVVYLLFSNVYYASVLSLIYTTMIAQL